MKITFSQGLGGRSHGSNRIVKPLEKFSSQGIYCLNFVFQLFLKYKFDLNHKLRIFKCKLEILNGCFAVITLKKKIVTFRKWKFPLV